MSPKVSIIIPTHNRAHLLQEAVDSALAQDYRNLEIIIADNASEDNTSDIIKRYTSFPGIKYFRNESNIGMVLNWRKALYDYATGDWFIILSDDDFFIDSAFISKAVRIVENNPNIVLVYSNGYILNEEKNNKIKLELPFNEVEEGKNIFLSRGKVKPQDFALCGVLFNTAVALSLNPFLNRDNLSCDSELFLKMCLLGNVGIVKDFEYVYRVHPLNMIKKINQNIDLMVNNLEYLIEPYLMAKKTNTISSKELFYWKKNVVIPEIIFILSKIFLFHKDVHSSVMEKMEQKYPELMLEVRNTLRYKLRSLWCMIRLILKAGK